jgi:hypothetical protein
MKIAGSRTGQARVPLKVVKHTPSKDASDIEAVLHHALQDLSEVTVEVGGSAVVLGNLVNVLLPSHQLSSSPVIHVESLLVLEGLAEAKFGKVDSALGRVPFGEVGKERADKLPSVLKPRRRWPVAECSDRPASRRRVV